MEQQELTGILAELVEEGLVQVERSESGETVYTLTELGQRALTDAIEVIGD